MIRGALDIAAPRATVWSLLTNPARTPEYAPGIATVEVLSGEPGSIGTASCRIHFRGARRPGVLEMSVTESAIDERYVFSGATGLVAFDGRYELGRAEPAGDGFRGGSMERTHLRYEVAYRLNGPVSWALAAFLLGLPYLSVVH